MGYLPLFLDVTEKACVVIGGGEIAERKVRSLMASAAAVTIISPSLTEGLAEEVRRGTVVHLPRCYTYGDIRGHRLAFVATGERRVAEEAAREAEEFGIPLNVADMPALCTFIAPSIVRRGNLQIAISTGGASPALARILRRELDKTIGGEYAALLEILSAVRNYLREHQPNQERRADVLNRLAECTEIRAALRCSDFATIETLLIRYLGVGMQELGVEPRLLHINRVTALSDIDSK